MNQTKLIKIFYVIAGLYDGVLGVAFLFVPSKIFEYYNVTPPNHMAYVQFSALLLIIFSIMFFQIASNPIKNRSLILYGCFLKVSYCGMAFGYMLTSSIPSMWKPFAYVDLGFLILFIFTWINLDKQNNAAIDSNKIV